MSFFAFLQDNLLLFAAAAATLGGIVALEVRSFRTRGADLSTTALTQQVNQGALLVDLRTQEEFASGHIVGAKNIPFDTLDKQINRLGDKDNNIVFYCNAGLQSSKIVTKLRKDGYTDVKHLKGGIATWRADSLPVVNKS